MAALAFDRTMECPAPGIVLCSKYRLVRELGAGGMGTVWLARNEALGKDVAVKLLLAGIDATDAAERFVREARAAASVAHPAIVSVFDYGTTDTGEPFIVMERLEGESLEDRLDRDGPMTATEAIRWILPVIDGLAAAHEHGVVHRDLKPANVFLAREAGHAQPKVLDFGVAKLLEPDVDLRLTRQGAVVGSPAYMSPEQAQGLGDVDSRADVWAISVVIYEAISGRTPFDGDNYNAMLASILVDDVPPLVERPGEEGLWDILSAGLCKDRTKRFQSMRDLGDALAAYLVRHGVQDDVRGVPLTAVWSAAAEESRKIRQTPSLGMWSADVLPARRGPWVLRSLLAAFVSVALGGVGYGLWIDGRPTAVETSPSREPAHAAQAPPPTFVATEVSRPPSPPHVADAPSPPKTTPKRQSPASPPAPRLQPAVQPRMQLPPPSPVELRLQADAPALQPARTQPLDLKDPY